MSSRQVVEIADTLPPDGEDQRAASTHGLPIAHWERYELLELLGRGGMGAVYRARDRRLGRILAIKFIAGADPNLTVRFLREARAQVSIDHPNICRVYEVGEVEGHPYIALQFIDGQPLHEAAAQMSLDDKVAVLRDVAVAIQEAHRCGVLHRDLKPANIMVRRGDDGRWVPVVTDFGLAREATFEVGITESGVPLGTPAYMPPEQARGDVRAIDHRSDVYSLGATLYELVTGRPPFVGPSLATVLAQVLHDDPPAPRSLVPDLAPDLETIALKCLAKDPDQRYPSARALADDLGHYLNREPILGRRAPLWQRIRLRARRHRGLVMLGAWSLVIMVAIAALGVRGWLITGRRTRLAQRLSRQATEIEGQLREAYLSPLHDTRPDRARIRDRMHAIATSEHDLGEFGDALVHDALGRGHLALHEWRAAADEFAAAAAAGLDTPELHAAHGRTLGELYRRALEDALEDARRVGGDRAVSVQTERELARRYLTPALSELGRGGGSGGDAALLKARIALYSGDFAGADRIAQASVAAEPGSPDARALAADTAYSAAIAAFNHGDYEVARTGLERATALYAQASEIARSDPSLYQAAVETWLARAEIAFRQKHPPGPLFDRALDLIDHAALIADPDAAAAHMIRSYVLLRASRRSGMTGQGDARQLLDQSIAAAERAIQLAGPNVRGFTELGIARTDRGVYERDHDGPAVPWLRSAIGDFHTALSLQPNDLQAHNGLGAAHRWLGSELDKVAEDPMPEYEAALRSYQRASEIDPQYLNACANQIDVYVAIAEHDDAIGSDPRSVIDQAERTGERCLAIDHRFFKVLDNLVQSELALAHYLVETHQDPGPALGRALDYNERAAAGRPEAMVIWYRRLTAATLSAAAELQHGGDPARSIQTGRQALAEALRLEAPCAYCQVAAARLDLLDAERARDASAKRARLTSALGHADAAIALDPRLALAKITAAEVCLQLAKLQPSRAIAARGIGYVEPIVRRDPRLVNANTVLAALQRLSAP
jgi:serine/threonine-protein kinase